MFDKVIFYFEGYFNKMISLMKTPCLRLSNSVSYQLSLLLDSSKIRWLLEIAHLNLRNLLTFCPQLFTAWMMRPEHSE